MPLHFDPPAQAFGIGDHLFDLLDRVAGSSHSTMAGGVTKLVSLLTYVNINEIHW